MDILFLKMMNFFQNIFLNIMIGLILFQDLLARMVLL